MLLPASIGFGGSLLVALLRIGGGFVLIPAMLYILRMPPQLVSGTSLFQIIFTTALATVLQAAFNQSVDIVLALFLLAGSVVGVPFGTRAAARIKPEWARFLMALLILAVAVKIFVDLTVTPARLYALDMELLS